MLSTGGGLVFRGSDEGNFFALDAGTGKALWEFQTGGAVVANPVAFAVDGKECVGIAAGKVFWVFELGRQTPLVTGAPRNYTIAVRTLLLLAALVVGVHAQTTARDYLNEGVNAFKSGNYAAAVDRFKAAIALDPTFDVAHLYLATAYVQQFVPGTETVENRAYAAAAVDEFSTVLQKDPNNLLATQSLASLYYNMRDFPNAEEWNRKVLWLNPNNKEAYYTLGVIPWTEFIGPDREARAHEQMKPEDPAPLNKAYEREALRAKYWQPLTKGIENEKRAIAIDPEYANAMAYMNLLIRYRADLDDSKEQAQADVKEADSWVEKALQAQKRKAGAPNEK